VRYAAFALGYQADASDASWAVGVKDPTIVAVPTAVTQHLQDLMKYIITVYNRQYKGYYNSESHPWHHLKDYFWDPDEWLTNASLSVLENFMPNVLFLHLPMLDLWRHFYGPGTPIAIDTLKHTNEQIGRVVDELEELGIYEQTTVFVRSDHGFRESNQVCRLRNAT
jgi:predicted AlkP superfamily pyrophosphatase or phosphodiesterase